MDFSDSESVEALTRSDGAIPVQALLHMFVRKQTPSLHLKI